MRRAVFYFLVALASMPILAITTGRHGLVMFAFNTFGAGMAGYSVAQLMNCRDRVVCK